MPGYGKQTAKAGRAFWRARRDMTQVVNVYQQGSLLAANFNHLWATALNRDDIGYFAMLHDDIGAEDFWLDTLIGEMESEGLDILGVPIPIKDMRGVTSLAIHEPGDNWRIRCRLSMADIFSLPETFTSEDLGAPLLLNTGCWVCRFDPAWREKVHFTINDEIVYDTGLKRFIAITEPEDWYFSRLLHELGLKIGATRKVHAVHTGEVEFLNSHPWGQCSYDREYVSKSPVPEVDRDGFRYPRGVKGWLSYDEGKALWRLARGKRVLEIGSYCGLSTICMAQAAGRVVAIDPHDGRGTAHPGTDTHAEFWANIHRHDLKNVECIRGTSSDVLRQSERLGTLADLKAFNLIFIDGAHDTESVRTDIRHALPLLAPGGLLAFHDYDKPGQPIDPGVKVAVDELVANGGEILEISDRLAVVRPPALVEA